MSTDRYAYLLAVYDLIPPKTGLHTRVANALWREHIEMAGDLTERTEADLLDIRNFGPGCLAIVKAALAEHGLALRGTA